MKGNPDPTFNMTHTADTSLTQWLSRPVLIKTYPWTEVGGAFSGQVGVDAADRQFNPWQLFFENPYVKEKINHYNLCRGRLKVKFVINGGPLFFGRVMPSYTPLSGHDTFHDVNATNLMGTTAVYDLVPYTQRPILFLDPATNQGGEFHLPYIYPANSMRLTNADWQDMGVINMFTLVPLINANSQENGVINIQVYAWMDDVTLSVPTTHTAQTGETTPSEYKLDGAISQPMSAISKIANGIAAAGIFKPYAMATSMVATQLANAAYHLGFSRPPVVEDIHPFVPRLVGNLANTNAPDTVQKLTLDVKQETTVDTRVMGFNGKDELGIADIATIESVVDVVPWNHAEQPGNLLWNAAVTPFLPVGSPVIGYHLPACSFTALPFKFWKGTMKYRFQVVASNFHKGRLRVSYDPVDFALTGPAANSNLAFNTVIDLDETRDFTIPIGWGSQFPMLKMRSMSDSVALQSESSAISGVDNFANGVVRVEVLNELTSPGPELAVYIIVSISAGDDIEFFEPVSDSLRPITYFNKAAPASAARSLEIMDPQTAELTGTTEKENSPHDSETLGIMAAKPPIDSSHLVFFGDPICSFRQLLKRYNFHAVVPLTNANGVTWDMFIAKWTLPDFPSYYGRDPNGMYITSESPAGRINYSNTTLLNYLTPAFVARRGGIRWKYISVGHEINKGAALRVERAPASARAIITRGMRASYKMFSSTALPWGLAYDTNDPDLFTHGHAGMARTPVANNPCLEIELPWYNFFRFSPARRTDFSTSRPEPPINENENFHTLIASGRLVDGVSPYVEAHVAAAEDFNLAGFIGAPRMWELSFAELPQSAAFA